MTQAYTVTAEAAGQRLDIAAAALTGLSRSQLQKMTKEGRLMLNGESAPSKEVVNTGDTITVMSEVPGAEPLPIPKLPILFEDDNVLIVDKPAGLAVHLSESGRPQPTVADFARSHGVEDDDPDRPGIVHRLDKDTSGVLVLAKNPRAKAELQRLFRQRKVTKRYLALVRGRLKQDEAEIRLPIGRNRKRPVLRAVIPGARDAVTAYTTLQSYPGYTLVSIRLLTGRTHQIRVHFSHVGHPVAGDRLYGEAKAPKNLTRQFLHASSIEFELDGKRVHAESPLPPDLQSFLVTLE